MTQTWRQFLAAREAGIHEALSPEDLAAARARMRGTNVSAEAQPAMSPTKKENLATVQMFLKGRPDLTFRELMHIARNGSYRVDDFLRFAKAEGFDMTTTVSSAVEAYRIYG